MNNLSFDRVTQIASAQLPINFKGLWGEVEKIDGPFIHWKLRCKCGSTRGEILAGRLFEGQHRDPLMFCCSKCSKSVTFFDSARDGYDGLLNHGSSYRQHRQFVSTECTNGHQRDFLLSIALGYQLALGELEEIVSKEGGHAADYFDMIAVRVVCSRDDNSVEIGIWECA